MCKYIYKPTHHKLQIFGFFEWINGGKTWRFSALYKPWGQRLNDLYSAEKPEGLTIHLFMKKPKYWVYCKLLCDLNYTLINGPHPLNTYFVSANNIQPKNNYTVLFYPFTPMELSVWYPIYSKHIFQFGSRLTVTFKRLPNCQIGNALKKLYWHIQQGATWVPHPQFSSSHAFFSKCIKFIYLKMTLFGTSFLDFIYSPPTWRVDRMSLLTLIHGEFLETI